MFKSGIMNELRNVIGFIGESGGKVCESYEVDDGGRSNIIEYINDIIENIDNSLIGIDEVDENLGLDIDVDKCEFDRFGDYIDNDVEFKFFSFYKEGVLVEERDEKEIWVLWDFLRMKNNYDYSFFMFYEELLSMVNKKYEYHMIKFSSSS